MDTALPPDGPSHAEMIDFLYKLRSDFEWRYTDVAILLTWKPNVIGITVGVDPPSLVPALQFAQKVDREPHSPTVVDRVFVPLSG